MTFVAPPGFKTARVAADDTLTPLQIFTSAKPSIKIYYFIRSAEEGLSGDINDVFSETLDRVSSGAIGSVSSFPEAAVRADFFADRGGNRLLQVDPRFSRKLTNGMGVVLQADGLAEALVLILFTDFAEARSLIQDAFYSLKFASITDAG